jgi:hypothetical protein
VAKSQKTEETAEAPTEKITKTEAVKRALADGVEKPSEGVEYIKTKFGIEMTNAAFSVNKNNLKKKEAGGGGQTKKTKAAPTQNGDDGLDLARSVRELVNQYGADKVKAMADIIAG